MAAGVILAGTAWACTASRYIATGATAGTPGTTVQVTGTGFQSSNEYGSVEIRWNSLTGAQLGSAPGPNFSVSVRIPDDAKAGVYYINAVQTRLSNPAETWRASQPFEVKAATTTPTSVVTPPSPVVPPTNTDPAPVATNPTPTNSPTNKPQASKSADDDAVDNLFRVEVAGQLIPSGTEAAPVRPRTATFAPRPGAAPVVRNGAPAVSAPVAVVTPAPQVAAVDAPAAAEAPAQSIQPALVPSTPDTRPSSASSMFATGDAVGRSPSFSAGVAVFAAGLIVMFASFCLLQVRSRRPSTRSTR